MALLGRDTLVTGPVDDGILLLETFHGRETLGVPFRYDLTLLSDDPNIAVDKVGDVYIDKKPLNVLELGSYLSNKFVLNTNLSVYISGDKDATHGSVIRVLDTVRREGIQKVSFAISPQAAKE